MKTKGQGSYRQPARVDDATELRGREAYLAMPARVRVLGDLAVANRVIKAQIRQQSGAKASETVKNRY